MPWTKDSERHRLAQAGVFSQTSYAPQQAPYTDDAYPVQRTVSEEEMLMQGAMTGSQELSRALEERDGERMTVREQALRGSRAIETTAVSVGSTVVPGFDVLWEGTGKIPLTNPWLMKQQREYLQKRIDQGYVRGLQLGMFSGGELGLVEHGEYEDDMHYIRIYKGPKSTEVRKEFRNKDPVKLERQFEEYINREL